MAFETARVGRGFAFGPSATDKAELRHTFHTVGNTPKLEKEVAFDLASSKLKSGRGGGGYEKEVQRPKLLENNQLFPHTPK